MSSIFYIIATFRLVESVPDKVLYSEFAPITSLVTLAALNVITKYLF